MEWLLPLAAKSLLIAGGALLLLRFAEKRSASDRSWIAHLGLAGLLLLPVATFALPALDVEGPAFLVSDEAAAAPVTSSAAMPEPISSAQGEGAVAAATFPDEAQTSAISGIDWPTWAYAVPALILILLTLIALGRLVVLKARATVMVDAHWLSALAHAQRRMGFKHGTALLTSDELPSPISWGLVRPVILLNREAAGSHADAEAIIAHELAHVARLDWAKLMVARVATAIFWFNPLVWLLAREAHQLREEAADDAVLASNIEDTDYARLLVGVARHECRGLLIGAHGVAPGRNSLARRVKRVLDSASARAPGGWRWSSAAAFFAAGMAVPVAAINFVPVSTAPPETAQATEPTKPYYVGSGPASVSPASPTDSAAPAASQQELAALAVHPHTVARSDDSDNDPDMDVDMAEMEEDIADAVADVRAAGVEAAASVRQVDQLIAASVHGVTPQYIARMRAVAPQLHNIRTSDFVGMKIQGVSPEYVEGLEANGLRGLDSKQLTAAAIHGVNGAFLKSMAAAGYPRLSYKEAVKMRIMGVTPSYVVQLRKQGYGRLTPKQVIDLRTYGFDPGDRKDDP